MARAPTATFALTYPDRTFFCASGVLLSIPRQSRLVPSVPRRFSKRCNEEACGWTTGANFIREAAAAHRRRTTNTERWLRSGYVASSNEEVPSLWTIKAPAALPQAPTDLLPSLLLVTELRISLHVRFRLLPSAMASSPDELRFSPDPPEPITAYPHPLNGLPHPRLHERARQGRALSVHPASWATMPPHMSTFRPVAAESAVAERLNQVRATSL